MSKVKVPGGAFYAGEGLEVDPITRTVSAGVGGAQPDWNQSDETASDYIKNRPGGYEGYVLYQTTTKTKTFNATSDAGKFKSDDTTGYFGEFGANYGVSDGKIDVIFNGVEYKNVDSGQQESSTCWVGDKDLVKYPFCLDVCAGMLESREYKYACYSTVEGTVEIIVRVYDKQIVQIPSKYVEAPSILSIDASDGNAHAVVEGSAAPYTVYIRVTDPPSGPARVEVDSPVLTCGIYGGKSVPVKVNGGHMQFIGLNSNAVYAEIKENAIILKSSTTNSSKYFKITVDDTGTLTATETTI